jgi:serine/threonine-protein kinase
VKVADFGFARLVEHSITACDGGMTLGYAAPEFFSGQAVKHRSDQYSLAATYCRLRSGRALFDARLPVEWMVVHTREEPDLGYLPAEERPTLAKALAKDPTARWASCAEFVLQLATSIREAERKKAAANVRKPVPGRTTWDTALVSLAPGDPTWGREGGRRGGRATAALVSLAVLSAVGVAWLLGNATASGGRRGDEDSAGLRKELAEVRQEGEKNAGDLRRALDHCARRCGRGGPTVRCRLPRWISSCSSAR